MLQIFGIRWANDPSTAGQGAVLVERRSGVERQQQREPVGQGGAGLNITFL